MSYKYTVNEFSQDTDTPNTEQAVDQQMQTGRDQNIEETEFNDSTAAEPADIVSESQPGKGLETQPHSEQVTTSQSNGRVTRATKKKKGKRRSDHSTKRI